jgi:ferredoxin--NADP+ reductase
MALNWKKATVVKKQIWAEGLFTLTVDVPGVEVFEPGQFLQVGLQVEDKHIHRPYSVASPHGAQLDFYIVLVEDGELTPKLWRLQEGDELDVSEKAAGSFTLTKTPEAKHLWLIATGTGLAPYIAMLRTDEPWSRYEKIVVVHGVRLYADLAYLDELRGFEKRNNGQCKYIPILTRETHPDCLSGRIPICLDEGSLESAAGVQLSAADSALLLCGNPQMLDDVEAKLGQRGMQRHRRNSPGQIVLERYW